MTRHHLDHCYKIVDLRERNEEHEERISELEKLVESLSVNKGKGFKKRG